MNQRGVGGDGAMQLRNGCGYGAELPPTFSYMGLAVFIRASPCYNMWSRVRESTTKSKIKNKKNQDALDNKRL